MPQARLRALQQVLRTLVEHPVPRALVVACTPYENAYVVHTLGQLDEHSPSDRFFLVADPFTTAEDYVDRLVMMAHDALGPLPPIPAASPAHRISTLLGHLLADLPDGDHHLVFALVPSEVMDPGEFSALAEALLAAPFDSRLRLVLRDDRLAPRHFHTAARASSEQLHAHVFALPPELLLADAEAIAHDRTRPPEQRALSLIQLACLDLGHGRRSDAMARCEATFHLPTDGALQALARAIQADIHHHTGDSDAAIATGITALHLAVEHNALSVVQHAALALGHLLHGLGRTIEAAACFALVERASPFNPAIAAHARALRSALPKAPC